MHRRFARSSATRAGTFVVSVVVATSVASAAFAPTAFAQQPPSASVPKDVAAEAKKHFELGLKLYKEKETEAALLEFDKSYELGKRPSALRNKAQCLRDLKRSADAFGAYTQLLKVHGAELNPKEKADVERALEELKLVTGEVRFAVDQPDAEISVDGRVVGTSPMFGEVRLNVGAHKVKVAKTGFETFEAEITVVQQQVAKVDAHLPAVVTTGHVSVKEQNGAPVHVLIDGKDVGGAPWEGDLAPGTHTVELKAEKLASEVRNIEVTVKGKLDVVALATPVDGMVSIKADPPQAHIAIDGNEVGVGKFEGDVPPGTHQLDVTLVGYDAFHAPLVVERGQRTNSSVKLIESRPAATLMPRPPTDEDIFEGVYAKLGFAFLFTVTSPDYPTCSSAVPAENCSPAGNPGFPVAASMDLRVGYAFSNYWALEGVFAALGHQASSTINFNGLATGQSQPLDNESYTFRGIAGFLGPGIRANTHGDVVRGTFGVAVGGIYHYLNFREDPSNNTPQDSHGSYFAPGLLFDAGMQLGSTPGTRFSIGVTAWLEFPGQQSFDFNRSSAISGLDPVSGNQTTTPVIAPFNYPNGTQFYIGPRIGFEFGH